MSTKNFRSESIGLKWLLSRKLGGSYTPLTDLNPALTSENIQTSSNMGVFAYEIPYNQHGWVQKQRL